MALGDTYGSFLCCKFIVREMVTSVDLIRCCTKSNSFSILLLVIYSLQIRLPRLKKFYFFGKKNFVMSAFSSFNKAVFNSIPPA